MPGGKSPDRRLEPPKMAAIGGGLLKERHRHAFYPIFGGIAVAEQVPVWNQPMASTAGSGSEAADLHRLVLIRALESSHPGLL